MIKLPANDNGLQEKWTGHEPRIGNQRAELRCFLSRLINAPGVTERDRQSFRDMFAEGTTVDDARLVVRWARDVLMPVCAPDSGLARR